MGNARIVRTSDVLRSCGANWEGCFSHSGDAMRRIVSPTRRAVTTMFVIFFSTGALSGASQHTTIPASSSNAVVILDLTGKRLQSIYDGLQPSPAFRRALLQSATLSTPGRATARLQALVLRQGSDGRLCPVRAVAVGQGHPCNGHYMGPSFNVCTFECTEMAENYVVFYSMEEFPYQSGYWYPPGELACDTCENQEESCVNE